MRWIVRIENQAATSLGLLLLLTLLCGVAPGQYVDPPPGERKPAKESEKKDDAEEAPAPESDASTPAYRRALALQRSGKWPAALKQFRKLLENHPNSVHAEDIENRGGANAFLGVSFLHESGPPERRIDVTVMGDGFTTAKADQKLQERWAKLCLAVLLNEKVFKAYRSYFNFYFVRLASKEEGVDPKLTNEQKEKIEKRNKNRVKKRKTDFNTALDCKAFGPQGQVMADRRLVYKWLGVGAQDLPGCADDRQVVAFARFGRLGMGGGGIANVGRPDKSITVHEFGHSFVGLLDEYQGNPNPPRRKIMAPNASTTSDPEKVPWAHFLKKKVQGVGVFEGGATYSKGVWRPARSCAMNSAGNNAYCPVCREAAVLRIYSYVNPIDSAQPNHHQPIKTGQGSKDRITLVPMHPSTHKLQVRWYVRAAENEPLTDDEETAPASSRDGYARPRGRGRGEWWRRMSSGRRGRQDRSEYKASVRGKPSKLGKSRGGKKPGHWFPVGQLPPGRHVVTAQVQDPTPWVLEDSDHLLEERRSWIVTVTPR